MDQKTFIINTGSDSHKYALYGGERELARLHLEREGEKFICTLKIGKEEEKLDVLPEKYASPAFYATELLVSKKLIFSLEEIRSVALRIVAPGGHFLEHNLIDDEYLRKMESVKHYAPLHVGPVLEEIKEVWKVFPETKLYGISDSAFHASLPEVARRYAIPEFDSSTFGIYRYGYHGISVASVMKKLSGFGLVPARVIVCHLGSGSSITAVKNGKSIDNSMGLTPLEGLPMGSRVGNIDPGAVLAIGQLRGLSFADLEKYFNQECGLLALSGKTKDVRELIELEKGGDERAKLALDSFAYSVRKYIGAYIAALGGLDLLVFTATIGERSNIMRARISAGLEGLGVVVDENKNNEFVSKDGLIQDKKSLVQVAVVATDEMAEMARELQRLH